MSDLTDQFISESMGNPYTNPLLPTVDKLEEYYSDLEYEGNQITIQWATQEMREHQMNWVRVGLVAERVRRYRLYRPQYENWNSFCMDVLGKRAWQVAKNINQALVVMGIIKRGSHFYPTCQSQAQALLDCCKKTGEFVLDAWDKVVEQYPKSWMLSANNICAALGFDSEYDYIPKRLRKALKKIAKHDGVSFQDKFEELLEQEEERIRQEEEEELRRQEEEEQNPDKLETDVTEEKWFQEMKQDVVRHDNQTWFVATLARLLPKPPSQFGWLRHVKCQV